MNANIVLLPGDGIGPEVVEEGRRALEAIAKRFGHTFSFESRDIGGIAIDKFGDPFPTASLEATQRSHAVLLGAVGGPKWDDPKAKTRPEIGLFKIRGGLGLYANLRPVRCFKSLVDSSPLRPERIANVDLLMVRELTGGLYFGRPQERQQLPDGIRAVDTMVYTEKEIRRIVERAFGLARLRRKKVTSVDKANVLETSRLWRQLATEIGAKNPDIVLEHQLVDSCAMRLVTNPSSFDVIVTENMFGDILSDESAVVGGTLGLLPSASLGDGRLGLYEPIHGSAPDIAGQGIANPLGTILSCALLLRYSLELETEAKALETAVERVLDAGLRTKDLRATDYVSTEAMGRAVADAL
ncbi:MAG TPA: 3-isopropylmalate dehydrogenase [Polyangiaceae bacterium]